MDGGKMPVGIKVLVMLILAAGAAITLFLFSSAERPLAGPAQNATESPRGPSQEAINACSNGVGDVPCFYETPEGTVSGTCQRAGAGVYVCTPR